MARNDFFRNVRRAMLFMAPRVSADNPYTNPEYVERMLRGSDLWLTKGAVEGFRPEDFPELTEADRSNLEKAVHEFIGVARSLPGKEPAKKEQRDAAISPFMLVVGVVQKLLRDDWLSAAGNLLAEAENWARSCDWPSKRYPKEIAEDFIGTYNLDKLVFAVEGSHWFQSAGLPLPQTACSISR
jgi:hypothetical protein